MGNCIGEDNKGKENNRMIDAELQQSNQNKSKEFKLLLLGSGESGKSTIFKQMKIIHDNGYTEAECMMFRSVIRTNVLQSMKALINATLKLKIPIDDNDNKERAKLITESVDQNALINVDKMFTPEICEALTNLWNDPAIQEAYENRNKFQLLDSTEYFFTHIERIVKQEYAPTEQDVLRSRIKTTGIVEAKFEYGGFTFRLVDVGGQRNERKKWIHCFDDVTAVLFVTSLNEYDQKCYEDDDTPRMKESLVLFDEICNSRYFSSTPIILFLNKMDLFSEKIKKVDLNVCFEDYKGGKNPEEAANYIRDSYLQLNHQGKKIYPHFTTATDTNNIKNIFESIKDVIFQDQIN